MKGSIMRLRWSHTSELQCMSTSRGQHNEAGVLQHTRAAGGKWRAPVWGSIMRLVCCVTSELQGNGGHHQ